MVPVVSVPPDAGGDNNPTNKSCAGIGNGCHSSDTRSGR
jgi:hypothetical protein